MIPNTYHWLQSVCLPLPPTKHLNSRTLWWVEGWKLLLPVCLLCYTSPSSPYFTSLSFPISSQKTFPLLCFIFRVVISDPVLISMSLWPFPLLFPYSSSTRLLPIFVPTGRVQPYIRLFLRGSERCACRPWWQREQQSLTWTYAVRAPIYNSVS